MVAALQHEMLERERSVHHQEEQYQVSLERLNMTISHLEEKILSIVEDEQNIRFVKD